MKIKKVIDVFYPFLIRINEEERIQYFIDKDPNFIAVENRIFRRIFKYINRRVKLESESLDSVINRIMVLLDRFNFKKFGIDVDEEGEKYLKKFLAYKVIGFEEICPLIVDEHVREIYIDGPNKNIYIDHMEYGRLMTNISLDEYKLERFIFLLKMYTNLILTSTNPSAKVDLIINNIRLRISVDSFPLTNSRAVITIRKLDNKPLSLRYLINRYNKSVIPLLILLLGFKGNILIIGEPGSGKTTLASVLLNLLPSYWRIIAIEDTREFPEMRENIFIRYKVEPFESVFENVTKEKEIIKLLHRSPDWIVLGEIQDKRDVLAMFHAFSAGLKGIATFHATSLEEFIDRIVNSFGVDFSRIGLIDAIVIMNKKIAPYLIIREIKDVILIYKRGLLNPDNMSDLINEKFVKIRGDLNFISMKNIVQMKETGKGTWEHLINRFKIILDKFRSRYMIDETFSEEFLLDKYINIETLLGKYLNGEIEESYIISKLRDIVEQIWLTSSSNTKVSP